MPVAEPKVAMDVHYFDMIETFQDKLLCVGKGPIAELMKPYPCDSNQMGDHGKDWCPHVIIFLCLLSRLLPQEDLITDVCCLLSNPSPSHHYLELYLVSQGGVT